MKYNNIFSMENIKELDESFKKAYANCQPVFKKAEIIRIIALIISITIECGLLFFLYKLYENTTDLSIRNAKYFIMVFFLMCGVWHFIKKNIEFFIKDSIMGEFLKNFGELSWTYDDVIEKDTVKKALIFPLFNPFEFYTDDNFCGTYKNRALAISELRLRKGQGIYSVSVFKGVAVRIELAKPFEGNTIVVEKDVIPLSLLQPVVLEDTEWNSQFNVYSDNQIEARYILTPALMERIKSIKNTYQAKRIALSFMENSVIVGLDVGRDLFETCSLVKNISDKKSWEIMYYQLYLILKLCDLFNR